MGTDHPEAAQRLNRLLEPLLAPVQGIEPGRDYFLRTTSGGFELLRGDDRIQGAAGWPDLVSFLFVEMNRAALANYGGFACHAGVVAAEGRAAAFPAPARGGKSTLTSACVKAGWDYVSDEALCLDFEDGLVAAYPRPLELSEWSRDLLQIRLPSEVPDAGDAFVSVAEIGGRVATGAIELAHIVVPEIGSGPPALRRVPRARVVTNLLRQSFNHYKHPFESFRLTSRLAEHCDAWRLTYSSAIEAAELLHERLVT